MAGPCEWPIVAPTGCGDLDALDGATEGVTRATVEAMAVSYLWNWTGKRLGLCEAKVRPARQDCQRTVYAGESGSGLGTWSWSPMSVGCGSCAQECGCSRVISIRLPGPINTVTEVRVDGDVLAPAAYRVENGKRLVRQDGGSWPVCNDLDAPDTAPGTWSVTYRQGVPVPEGGRVAAGVLACEFAKALSQSNDCRLPQRIQTVTREGVTVGVLDPFDGISEGRTGIWLIDSWVASVTHAPARSTVHSPDRRPMARTTFQAGP